MVYIDKQCNILLGLDGVDHTRFAPDVDFLDSCENNACVPYALPINTTSDMRCMQINLSVCSTSEPMPSYVCKTEDGLDSGGSRAINIGIGT